VKRTVIAVVLVGLALTARGSSAPGFVTAPPSSDFLPIWSADGSTIAFLRDTVGSWSLDTVPAAGGAVRHVADLPLSGPQDRLLPAAISPDLSKVAYPNGVQLRIANADGSGIVDVPLDPAALSWSRDGTYLAVGTLTTDVYVLRADGGDLHKVADGQFPAWAPDGSRIAFVTPYAKGIAIVDPDGSGLQTIWQAGQSTGPPAWSPAGDLLAFPSDSAIEVTRADGSHVTTFHGDISTNVGPTWSANGSKIAYRGGTGLSVYELSSGSSRLFRYAGDAAWAPNSDMFAEAHGYPCSPVGIHVTSASSGSTKRLTLGCRVDGTRRNDRLEGTEWSDVMSGRRGADRIVGFGSADQIFGGPGNDRINGGPYSDDDEGDLIDGGPGNDVLDGGNAQQADYGVYDDVLYGRSGNDGLRGGPGRDILDGGPGNDTIQARDGGRDEVRCGPGNDLALVDRRDHVARDCEHVRRR